MSVPRGLQEITQCQSLVDKVVFGQRLDSTILEVFSNLSDSMILILVIRGSELKQRCQVMKGASVMCLSPLVVPSQCMAVSPHFFRLKF